MAQRLNSKAKGKARTRDSLFLCPLAEYIMAITSSICKVISPLLLCLQFSTLLNVNRRNKGNSLFMSN